MNVPAWVYKRHAAGDISAEELENLEKFASSISETGRAGAAATVADPRNNLHQVMKSVPPEDRDDVLRALRQMKKQASVFTPEEYKQTMDWYRQKLKSNPNNKAMRADYESLRKHKSSLIKSASNCGTGHSNTKKRLKKMTKTAFDPATAGMIIGGSALAPVVGHLAMRGINALNRKSPQQMQQDLRRILQVHPDIGRPEDPRVQMAYASLVKLNPEYASDPLIAGPLLKQIVDSRMNPADPRSASYVDPGVAKGLSEARKAYREGLPRGTFSEDFGRSLSSGVRGAMVTD